MEGKNLRKMVQGENTGSRIQSPGEVGGNGMHSKQWHHHQNEGLDDRVTKMGLFFVKNTNHITL